MRRRRGLCSAQTRKLEAVNAAILSNMAGLLVREVWGAFEHRQKQRIRQARRACGRALPQRRVPLSGTEVHVLHVPAQLDL